MKKTLFALMGALMMASCAEKAQDISVREWETEVVAAWLGINYPNEEIPPLPKGEGGYVLVPPSYTGSTSIDNYVRYDITGKLLDGSIFKVTRQSDADMLMYKTATYYSRHFVPVFDSLGSENIPEGVREMLMYMAAGDSAVILLPSHKAYGSGTYSEAGYAAGVAANTPVIFEIALRQVVSNPRSAELDSVNAYIARNAGFVPLYDTSGVQLMGIYVRYEDTMAVTDSTPLPQADTALSLKYAGYYLDGFWLDTNIDSVARKWLKSAYKLQSSYLSTSTFSHTLGSTGSIPAFNAALGRLNRGSTIEFVFTSDYGYGSAGYGNVPPYTPLRFWVHRVK